MRRGLSLLGRQPLGLAVAHSLASAKGGTCVSQEYVTCAGKAPWTLEDAIALAARGGGSCLADDIPNSTIALQWMCAAGHTFKSSVSNIRKRLKKSTSWCPVCSRSSKKAMATNEAQDVARQRGGLCVSDGYTDSHATMQWKCAVGHTWHARLSSIKQGT
eukprot:1409110-Amphidinium_carterae.1